MDHNYPFCINIINQKGGVGKTTSTLCLAKHAAAKRLKTLLIDLDPNGHASTLFLKDPGEVEKTSLDFLKGASLEKCRYNSKDPYVSIIPASSDLFLFEKKYKDRNSRFKILEGCLEKHISRKEFQLILIDSSSSAGLLQLNSMTAAGMVVIPTIPEYLALTGFKNLIHSLKQLYAKLGREPLYYLLFTMYQKDYDSQKKIKEWAECKIQGVTLASSVGYNQLFMDATARRENIVKAFPESQGSMDYRGVFDELLRKAKEIGYSV